MARKKRPEEHENHERWLVSYADFITLLFALFVVMYAISSVNQGKYRVLSEALVAAFRSPTKSLEPIEVGGLVNSSYVPDMSTVKGPIAPIAAPIPVVKSPVDLPLKVEVRKRPLLVPVGTPTTLPRTIQVIAREVSEAMVELIDKDLVIVRQNPLWVEVEIKSNILFSSGNASLEPAAIPVLEKIADILRRFPNFIQVEGLTDNVPINTMVYPSNWELSAARAASVVHLFTKLGIKPQRMAAIGYGEHRPVSDNDTPEGRQKNRRVVLVILAHPDLARLVGVRAVLTQQ